MIHLLSKYWPGSEAAHGHLTACALSWLSGVFCVCLHPVHLPCCADHLCLCWFFYIYLRGKYSHASVPFNEFCFILKGCCWHIYIKGCYFCPGISLSFYHCVIHLIIVPSEIDCAAILRRFRFCLVNLFIAFWPFLFANKILDKYRVQSVGKWFLYADELEVSDKKEFSGLVYSTIYIYLEIS